MNYQLINGKIMRAEEALIPLNDLGLLRGYSVFDYFRVLEGVPVFIEEHVKRLKHSAQKIDLELIWSEADIEQMCYDLVEANGGAAVSAGMRIVVTGGFAADGYTPTDSNLFITLHPLPAYADTDYIKGRALITSNYTRSMADIKTTGYSHVLSLRKQMKEANAIEILYHTNGLISECSRANIFFVKQDDSIVTPSSNLLYGITRKHVMDLARNSGFTVTEGDVHLKDLPGMKEAFLSSTTKGVMPIVRIDDIAIGNGEVGKITNALKHSFQKLVNDYLASHRPSPEAAPEV